MTRCPPSPSACSFTTTAQNRKLEEPGAWIHMVYPLPADPSQDLVSSPGISNLPTCTCAHTCMLSFTHKPLYLLKAIIPRVHTLAHTHTHGCTHTEVNVNRPPCSHLHTQGLHRATSDTTHKYTYAHSPMSATHSRGPCVHTPDLVMVTRWCTRGPCTSTSPPRLLVQMERMELGLDRDWL